MIFILKFINPIICLSETWFDLRVDHTCVFISNIYSVVSRIDRCNGSHGGVVIGLKTEINVHSETIQAKSPVDFATSALFCNLEQAIIVLNVFNPPHDSPYRLEVEFSDAYLHDIINSNHEKVLKNDLDLINVLIVGDVHLPGIDWSLLSSNTAYEKTFSQIFRRTKTLKIIAAFLRFSPTLFFLLRSIRHFPITQ